MTTRIIGVKKGTKVRLRQLQAELATRNFSAEGLREIIKHAIAEESSVEENLKEKTEDECQGGAKRASKCSERDETVRPTATRCECGLEAKSCLQATGAELHTELRAVSPSERAPAQLLHVVEQAGTNQRNW